MKFDHCRMKNQMIFLSSFSIATTISFADTFTKQVGMSSGIMLQQH